MFHISWFLKVQNDTNAHQKNNNQLIEGMYNCPFTSVGYFYFGQKFNRMASFINVNENH
jgi:hypothetical protein